MLTFKNKEEYWKAVEDHWPNIRSMLSRWLSSKDFKEVEKLKTNKDSKLVSYFNKAWFNAPDSGATREVAGFFVLCDLCSESYILHEGEEINE